jgi:hypothetical protein
MLHQIYLNDEKFTQEREFFLKQSLKDQEIQANLNSKISLLEKQLEDERKYSYKIFLR